MTTLPDHRVGPYIRALRAGVRILAPDADHVSAAALGVHLEALDPHVSGPLLLPGRIDLRSGLPNLAWMDRVRAERDASVGVRATDPKRVEAIRRTDPELAERLMGRVRMLGVVGQHALVPELQVQAQMVRRGEGRNADGRRVRITLDRRIPGAGWTRIRVEADNPEQGRVVRSVGLGGDVVLQAGFADLLARHVVSPLAGLHGVLREVAGLQVHRLSRGVLGPFWFPGGPEPEGAPEWSRGALVLHLGLEVIGVEVRNSAHHDPFVRGLVAGVEGGGVFRGRRLAVSPGRVDAARAWVAERVGVADVVGLVP